MRESGFNVATLEARLMRQTYLCATVTPTGSHLLSVFAAQMVNPWSLDDVTEHDLAGKEAAFLLSAGENKQTDCLGEVRLLSGFRARRDHDDLQSTQPPVQIRLYLGETARSLVELAQTEILQGRHVSVRLEVLKQGSDRWRAGDYVEDTTLQVVRLEMSKHDPDHAWGYP